MTQNHRLPDPTVREMVRSTLSHEVESLLLKVDFARRELKEVLADHTMSDGEAAIEECRKAITQLSDNLRTAKTAIVETETVIPIIFRQTNLLGQTKIILTKANLLVQRSHESSNSPPSLITAATSLKDYAVNLQHVLGFLRRIYSDNLEAQKEAIRPTSLIQNVLNSLKKEELRYITLNKDFYSETFIGERGGLIIALSNLLQNAVKYTRPNFTAEVTFGLQRLQKKDLREQFKRFEEFTQDRKEKDWLVFVIIDKGEGISESAMGQLIKPMMRWNPESKKAIRAENMPGFDPNSPHNLGMGLTIAKRVAEDHAGTLIGQPNRDGHGMTFALMFPFIPPPS